MAAYRRVYDSRHLQADCQQPGSAPKPYARQSSMGYLYLFYIWRGSILEFSCTIVECEVECGLWLATVLSVTEPGRVCGPGTVYASWASSSYCCAYSYWLWSQLYVLLVLVKLWHFTAFLVVCCCVLSSFCLYCNTTFAVSCLRQRNHNTSMIQAWYKLIAVCEWILAAYRVV